MRLECEAEEQYGRLGIAYFNSADVFRKWSASRDAVHLVALYKLQKYGLKQWSLSTNYLSMVEYLHFGKNINYLDPYIKYSHLNNILLRRSTNVFAPVYILKQYFLDDPEVKEVTVYSSKQLSLISINKSTTYWGDVLFKVEYKSGKICFLPIDLKNEKAIDIMAQLTKDNFTFKDYSSISEDAKFLEESKKDQPFSWFYKKITDCCTKFINLEPAEIALLRQNNTTISLTVTVAFELSPIEEVLTKQFSISEIENYYIQNLNKRLRVEYESEIEPDKVAQKKKIEKLLKKGLLKIIFVKY